MYQCKNCKETFDEPQYIVEREMIDYGIGREWVTLFEGNVCPYCEGIEIEPIEESETNEQETEQ